MGGFLGEVMGSIPWGQITTNARELFGMNQKEGRVDNENFQWAESQANEHNTNEIGRQQEYLSGMAPAQAGAYNTYQDATYGEDTKRQIGRIQDTATALGMSPWELNGGSAATPVPTGDFGGGAKNTKDADPTGQGIAGAQLKNQKEIAGLQAATQLATTQMQTGTQKFLGGQATNNGEIGRTQTDLNRGQKELQDLQKELTTAQTVGAYAGAQKTVSDAIANRAATAFSMLPKRITSLPTFSETSSPGAYKIIQWLNAGGDQANLQSKMKTLSPDEISGAINDVQSAIAKMPGQAAGAAGAAQDFIGKAGQFLGMMQAPQAGGGPKKTERAGPAPKYPDKEEWIDNEGFNYGKVPY